MFTGGETGEVAARVVATSPPLQGQQWAKPATNQ
jgi:hypothetical protein